MAVLSDIFSECHDDVLRYTQTNVKHQFACDALSAVCVPCNNGRMKVWLEHFREKQDLILEDIASQIGVAVSTVQRWEKQSMSIPSERLPVIARAYKCQITQIFSDDDASEPPQTRQPRDALDSKITQLTTKLDEPTKTMIVKMIEPLAGAA